MPLCGVSWERWRIITIFFIVTAGNDLIKLYSLFHTYREKNFIWKNSEEQLLLPVGRGIIRTRYNLHDLQLTYLI